MKRPTLTIDQPAPAQSRRADLAPDTGFAIVVDGHLKTQVDMEAARKVGTALLDKNPRLRVEIYEGAKKTSVLVRRTS